MKKIYKEYGRFYKEHWRFFILFVFLCSVLGLLTFELISQIKINREQQQQPPVIISGEVVGTSYDGLFLRGYPSPFHMISGTNNMGDIFGYKTSELVGFIGKSITLKKVEGGFIILQTGQINATNLEVEQ